MHITQTLSFVAKHMTTSIARKASLISLGFIVLAAGVVAGQNLLSTPDSAQAATPPDSCFAFDAGTGTITDYYNNEANNAANPACPRAVDIPATIGGVSVVSIGNYAFHNNQLTSVTIPSGVTSIGSYAFSYNQLTSVTIPSSVTSIGNFAFSYNQLTSVTIPSSVTKISDWAFSSNQLTTVTIPSGVTSIGSSAFDGNQLTSVTIPEGVTSIGSSAFQYNRLTSVTIPSSVTSILHSAFQSNRLTSVTIPSSVTSIGTDAFLSNQLTTVTIPNPAASMQHSSFDNNPISSMTIGSTTYTEQSPTTDSVCFARTGSTVTDYYQASPIVARDSGVLCGRDVVIPVDITSIGNYAFSYNQLTTVTIPSGVTSIGNSAFRDNQLTTVTIPEGVTSIGYSAFSDNQLTSVTIPSSVTSIRNFTFYGNQLTTVTIPSGVTSIGADAFSYNQLTSVTIPSSVTSIDPMAFAIQNPWGRDLDWCDNGAPCIWSDDPAEVQRAYDSIWYVKLYTADPSNPHNIQDGVMSEEWWGKDANANGTTRDSLGGHLVNPSSTDLRSLDRSGSAISTSQTITGMLNGSPLNNYLASQGPVLPEIADLSNPTPSEQAALDQAFSAYHRAGSTQTFTPQAISGYITPAPQAKTLVAGDNTLEFIYKRPVLSVPFVSNDVTDGVLVPSTTPGSVASPLLSESKLSIANDNTCSTIQSAELLAPGSVTAPQDITILGGLGFTLDCTNGATTAVTLTLGSQTDLSKLRVYKDTAGALTDITSHMTFTTNNGKTVLTYNLTDGGALDEDGAANGIIVDPIYIGTLSDAGEMLAATGSNLWLLAGGGVLALLAGAAGLGRITIDHKKR